jgi:hypothetical protein
MPKEVTAPEVTSAIRQQPASSSSSTGMTVATASIALAAAVAALAAYVVLLRRYISILPKQQASRREMRRQLGELRTLKVQNETLKMQWQEQLQRDLERQADFETFAKRQDELQTLLAGSGK